EYFFVVLGAVRRFRVTGEARTGTRRQIGGCLPRAVASRSSRPAGPGRSTPGEGRVCRGGCASRGCSCGESERSRPSLGMGACATGARLISRVEESHAGSLLAPKGH